MMTKFIVRRTRAGSVRDKSTKSLLTPSTQITIISSVYRLIQFDASTIIFHLIRRSIRHPLVLHHILPPSPEKEKASIDSGSIHQKLIGRDAFLAIFPETASAQKVEKLRLRALRSSSGDARLCKPTFELRKLNFIYPPITHSDAP